MSKIWQVKSVSTFVTTFYVLSEEEPDVANVIELAKDGYIPEFDQHFLGEVPSAPPVVVSEEDFLDAWPKIEEEDVSNEEKFQFLINLDIKPPENFDFAEEFKI